MWYNIIYAKKLIRLSLWSNHPKEGPQIINMVHGLPYINLIQKTCTALENLYGSKKVSSKHFSIDNSQF